MSETRPGIELPKPRSSRRRWIFRGVVLVATWCLVELVSWFILVGVATNGYREVTWRRESFREMHFQLGERQDVGVNTQTVHPFVGWVRNPEILKGEVYEGTELKTNRLGFLDTSEGIFQRDPKRLIVGITGGSVAYQMSCAGAERLKEKLHAVPEYRDREIVIVRMAQSAYKQPQGLFALNYYMLQGGEFDIVINLDGLNELTMSMSQNYPLRVALDYPQGWNMRTAEIIPANESDIAMELIQIRGQRRKYALSGINTYWQWLPSQVLLWHIRDERLREQLVSLQGRTLHDYKGWSFVRCGPAPLAPNEAAALAESVRVWKQASLQMHRICQASGIHYVHAIQPNQYDPGSKPLTTSEVDLMHPESVGNQSQPFITIVPAGYPLLRQAGQELQSAGVRVIDLTAIFSKVSDSLYVDSCCHVNPTGSEMLAGAIGDFIRESDQAR